MSTYDQCHRMNQCMLLDQNLWLYYKNKCPAVSIMYPITFSSDTLMEVVVLNFY